MLVAGRSPSLILAAATAVFNVVVGFHVAGFNPTVEQVGLVNIALAAIIAVIANSDSIALAAGREAHNRLNGDVTNAGNRITDPVPGEPPAPPAPRP